MAASVAAGGVGVMSERKGVEEGVGGAFRGVPLAEAVGTLKLVRPDDPLVKAAREIGVSFGDTVPAAG